MAPVIHGDAAVQAYKEWVRSEFERVRHHPCGDAHLGAVFTEPELVERRGDLGSCWGEEEGSCLRGEIFEFNLTSRAYAAYQNTRLEHLLCGPQHHTHTHTHAPSPAVVLQGPAGYGKSVLVQKLLLDWASDSLEQKPFDLVLLLRCSEPSKATVERPLVDMLSHESCFAPLVSRELQERPGRVLIIVDGFEALRLPPPDIGAGLPPSPLAPEALLTCAPWPEALGALLRGRLLPQCPLLVTSRPAATDRLCQLLKQPQRRVDILGFSEQGVEQCFRRLLRDEEEEEEEEGRLRQALGWLRKSESLRAVCSSPLLCSLLCAALTHTHTHTHTPDDQRQHPVVPEALDTSAAVCAFAVSSLLRRCCRGSGQLPSALLRRLCRRALWEVMGQRLGCEDRSVCEETTAGESVCEAIAAETEVEAELSDVFGHPCLQEFLAALACVWLESGGPPAAREQLLRRLSLQGEEHTFSHAPNPDPTSRLLSVAVFLCGLTRPRLRSLLLSEMLLPPVAGDGGVSCLGVFTPPVTHCQELQLYDADLEEWLLGVLADARDCYRGDQLKLHVLHCLGELRDDAVTGRALDLWGQVQLSDVAMTPADCWVLRYCLLCVATNKSLALWRCHVTADRLRMLMPALTHCQQLELQVEGLSDADVPDLISVLGKGKNLRELGVAGSRLGDESVQKVLACLQQQESLGFISLSVQSISPHTATMLTQLLHTTEFELAELTSSGEDSCCSHFSIDAYTVTLSHHFHATHSSCEPCAPGLSFSMGDLAAQPHIDWKTLLHTYHTFRAPQSTIPCFEECVGALVSFLRALPHLGRVDLEVAQLSLTWAGALFSLLHTCPSLTHGSIQELRLRGGCGESLCSSISVNRDIDDTSLLTTEFCHQEECESSGVCVCLCAEQHSGPACSSLIITHSSRLEQPCWTQLLNTFHSLRGKVCEEQSSVLLSTLKSVSGLKGLFLRVDHLTQNWASGLLSLTHTCPSLQDASIADDGPPEVNHQGAVCSSLTLKRDEEGFMLSAKHPCRVDPEPELSLVSLTVPKAFALTPDHWTPLLREFGSLRPVAQSPVFDERVEVLLSSLHSLCGLKRVVLSVRRLTESWARRILFLMHTCPTLTYCSLEVAEPKSTDGESLCSTFSVTREPKNLRVIIQQAVSHEPRLSGLCVSLATQSDPFGSDTNWISCLQNLHALKDLPDSSPGFDEHVETLMAFLCSLTELNELSMKLLCVSAHWVTRILSLIHTCPSLLKVRLVAGRGWLGDGLIHEEAVGVLMGARKRPDCTLIIEGKRCSRSGDRCTEFTDHFLSCNTPVLIQSHGDSFQLTEIDNYHD